MATIIREGELNSNTKPGGSWVAGELVVSDKCGVGPNTVVATTLLPAAVFETCCSCDAINVLRNRERQ